MTDGAEEVAHLAGGLELRAREDARQLLADRVDG